VVAVVGGVEVVVVASAAGVRERLTESDLVVEVPALNLFTTVAHSHPVVASCIFGRLPYNNYPRYCSMIPL